MLIQARVQLFVRIGVQLVRARAESRARPLPAIENVSPRHVICTVTFDPVTNRIPDARRDPRTRPRGERQRHAGQVGLGVAGAVGHATEPALGDRAVDRPSGR